MQYQAIRYGRVLSDCDAVVSFGSKGDSNEGALAEVRNLLYKAELIRNHHYLDSHGSWEGIDDVEFATAEWVHWLNTTRPHCAIGMHAPIEHEQAYTPPPQDDISTIGDTTTEPDSDPKAMDIGEQTTSRPQPTTTGTR